MSYAKELDSVIVDSAMARRIAKELRVSLLTSKRPEPIVVYDSATKKAQLSPGFVAENIPFWTRMRIRWFE